jgi:hypothetical protein
MARKFLLDQFGGIVTEFERVDNRNVIHRAQDVTSIIEANKELYNNKNLQTNKDLRKVAEIPKVLYDQWCRELIQQGVPMFSRQADTYIKKKLNDPEFRAFRTHPGNL